MHAKRIPFFTIIIFSYSCCEQYIISNQTIPIPSSISSTVAYAQQQQPLLPTTSNQEWIDKQSNTKVSFSYSPNIPTVERFTELKFNVEGLNSGTRLKDLSAKLTLIDTLQQKQQSPIASYSLSAPEGYFSIKYRFPHEGTYQIIVKVNSKYSALTLASFKIFISFPTLAVINVKEIRPLLIPAALAGIVGTIAILVFMMVVNRKRKQ